MSIRKVRLELPATLQGARLAEEPVS